MPDKVTTIDDFNYVSSYFMTSDNRIENLRSFCLRKPLRRFYGDDIDRNYWIHPPSHLHASCRFSFSLSDGLFVDVKQTIEGSQASHVRRSQNATMNAYGRLHHVD